VEGLGQRRVGMAGKRADGPVVKKCGVSPILSKGSGNVATYRSCSGCNRC